MNIPLSILGSFLMIFGFMCLVAARADFKHSEDRYQGKMVWLKRSSDQPYFWSVSALNDRGYMTFVDGYQNRDRAEALFQQIASGIVTRRQVRERDEERTRQEDIEREKEPKDIVVESQ